MLTSIHKRLFTDVLPDDWVGVYRSTNIEKSEAVLDGRSVTYADWRSIEDYLKYDFAEEKKRSYSLPFTQEQVGGIAGFASRIWETHPFREGNTRTISTFIIKYLRTLGIDANNDPFKNHADWLRDAFALASYSDLSRNIQPDATYINLFFENILMGAEHDLGSIDL
jgi:fido (protein-threonine AMPylation protein)